MNRQMVKSRGLTDKDMDLLPSVRLYIPSSLGTANFSTVFLRSHVEEVVNVKRPTPLAKIQFLSNVQASNIMYTNDCEFPHEAVLFSMKPSDQTKENYGLFQVPYPESRGSQAERIFGNKKVTFVVGGTDYERKKERRNTDRELASVKKPKFYLLCSQCKTSKPSDCFSAHYQRANVARKLCKNYTAH
jgi:hypothetical protein